MVPKNFFSKITIFLKKNLTIAKWTTDKIPITRIKQCTIYVQYFAWIYLPPVSVSRTARRESVYICSLEYQNLYKQCFLMPASLNISLKNYTLKGTVSVISIDSPIKNDKQFPWTDTESLPKNYFRQRLCWIYKGIGVLWTGDPEIKKGQAISLFCKEM